MRITKRTNIAIRLLMYCAAHRDRLVTKSEVAGACNISENHLAHVINQLGQLDILHTVRGRKGGLALAVAPDELRIGQVFRQIEGDLPIAECFADADNSCPLTEACRLRIALQNAAEVFYASLDEITLDALVCGNTDLLRLLQPVPCGRNATRGPAEPGRDGPTRDPMQSRARPEALQEFRL